jgi:uncharacterized membrane protein
MFLTVLQTGQIVSPVGFAVVLPLAFAIGVIAGLRSLVTPAVVSWAVHLNWLDLHGSRLAFLGSTTAVAFLSALGIVELVMDKLASTPSRTTRGPLTARIVTGALCGSTLCAAASQSLALGVVLGGIGGIVGAFAGYQVRHAIVTKLHAPDFLIAVLEDLVTIGGDFFIVTRLL